MVYDRREKYSYINYNYVDGVVYLNEKESDYYRDILLTGILFGNAVWLILKGGKSMTIFDVDSDCLTVTINGENIIYKGNKEKK